MASNKEENDFIIKETKDRGKGLFTSRDINTGELLFHVDMRKMPRYTVEEIDALAKSNSDINGDHSHYVGRGKYVIENSMPAYINHSCDSNCICKMHSIAVYDIIAARDILAGEELTHDYGAASMDQLLGYFYWEDECHCGSKNCRGIIHGDFFKLPESFQKKHYPNLPPYIKQKYRKYFRKLFS